MSDGMLRRMLLVALMTILVFEAGRSVNAQEGVTAQERVSDNPLLLNTPNLRGGGNWGAAARDGKQAQQWEIDLQRTEGGSLTGRITLSSSPLMQGGVLEGKIVGRRVAGAISDDKGLHVATFVGQLTETGGLQGTYEDRTGEVGTWEWSGPMPK